MLSLNLYQRQYIFLSQIKKNQHIRQIEFLYIILDNVNNLFHLWAKELRGKKTKTKQPKTRKTNNQNTASCLQIKSNSKFYAPEVFFFPKVSCWKKVN